MTGRTTNRREQASGLTENGEIKEIGETAVSEKVCREYLRKFLLDCRKNKKDNNAITNRTAEDLLFFFCESLPDVMAEYRYEGFDSKMRMVIGRGYLQTIRRKQGGSPHTDAFSGIQ